MHITVSDSTLAELREAADQRGMDTDTYADELLRVSLAALRELSPRKTRNTRDFFIESQNHQALFSRHRLPARKTDGIMQYMGIAPSGRTAAEIDAEINEGRGPWPDEIAEDVQP